MSFLNPAFLWALTAVSIPIIIHLINFRRHKLVYFSNTKFLLNIRKETKSKTKLKQLLILLCRILTIVMLVLVFAGPYFPYDKDPDTDTVDIAAVYIDNSFSMQAEAGEGVLFNLVRNTAIDIANSMETNIRFLLITNELRPEHQAFMNTENFVSEVGNTEISPFQISLDEVVLKVNELVPADNNAVLYVLSDMQRNFIREPELHLNENIRAVFMPFVAGTIDNISIDTCYFETPIHRLNEQEKLFVRISSHSTEDNYNIPLQLYINDTLKAFAGVNIMANETKTVELSYVNTAAGNINGRVQITDYPIVYDNTLFFNYYISEKINILMINGLNNNRFISSLYNSDPANFNFTTVRQGDEHTKNFSSYDLIILNDIAEISTGLSAEIHSFMSEGGSVVYIPAKEINHQSSNNFLSLIGAGVFSDTKFEGRKINYIDFDNKLFIDVFQQRETNVDLPDISISHGFQPNNAGGPAVILRTDNRNPFLTHYYVNQGQFYMFSAPTSEENISFARHPLFVPVFYNIAVNSHLNNPLYVNLKVNEVYEIVSMQTPINNEIIRIKDDKSNEYIPRFSGTGSSLNIFIPEEIDYAGNFSVYAGENFISGLALNYDRAESIADFLNKDELSMIAEPLYGNNTVVLSEKLKDFGTAIQKLSIGKMLWRYFVMLSLLFVVCEILIIRFMK